MEYLKDKANQVSETVQGKGSEASAEGNKQAVKDSDSLGTKASAAKDYVVDKKDQKSHETKANVHDAKSDAR